MHWVHVALFMGLCAACGVEQEPSSPGVPHSDPSRPPTHSVEVQGWLYDSSGSAQSNTELQIFTTISQGLGGFVPGRRRLGVCTTNEKGHFSCELPSDVNYLLIGVQDEGITWFPWGGRSLRETDRALGMLRVPQRSRVAGIVLDSEGQAAAGWSVRIGEADRVFDLVPAGFFLSEYDDLGWTFDSAGSTPPSPDSGVLETITDEHGSFSFEGRFANPLLCYVDAAGIPHFLGCGSPSGWNQVTLRAHPLEQAGFGFMFEGGTPATGAQAAVPVSSCLPDYVLLKPVAIDEADGRVLYLTESPSICTAALRRSDSDPWFVRSDLYMEDVPRVLELPSPARLELRVLDQAQRPVVGATVRGLGSDGFVPIPAGPGVRSEHLSVWQEPDPGIYTWNPSALEGSVAVMITAPGKALGMYGWEFLDPVTYMVAPDWNEVGEVDLHDARSLVVRILSEGAPVKSALIQSGPWTRWSSHEPRCPLHGELSTFLPRLGVTDEQGRWDAGELCALGDTFGVRIGATAYDLDWDGTTSELTVDVGPVSSVHGVVSFQGKPVAHAMLSFADEDHNELHFYADDQGRFETRALEGTYVLEVTSAEVGGFGPLVYATGVKAEGGAALMLDLKLAGSWTMPTATLNGKIFVDSIPFDGWLHLTCAPGTEEWEELPSPNYMFSEELLALAESEQSSLQFPQAFAVPVVSGRLESVQVPAGCVTARLYRTGESLEVRRPPIYSGVLVADQVLDLSLSTMTGTLRVEVVDASGSSVSGARVTVGRAAPADGEVLLTTGPSGRCEVELEPGTYQIAATLGRGSSYPPVTRPDSWSSAMRVEETVTIEANQTIVVRLTWGE